MMDRPIERLIRRLAVSSPDARPNRRTLWTDPRLVLWNLLMIAISPWLLANMFRRAIRRADRGHLDLRRWTLPGLDSASNPRRQGSHVVFAGENFGELLMMKGLTDRLEANHSDLRITWMIRDATSMDHVRKKYPERSTCFWPFDLLPPVGRFLDRLQPDVLVLTERFRFTNLVCGSHHHGAKVILINGRFKRLDPIASTFFLSLYRWTFGRLSLVLMQSTEYADRVRQLVPDHPGIRVVPDLKQDLSAERAGPELTEDLRGWSAPSSACPILAAGSTDSLGEEEFVLEAFKATRMRKPCRLLLAPRDVKRVDEVCVLLQRMGLSYSRRSRSESGGEVLLLDTLGELATAYQFCAAAYVGGSFDGMGHNVLEPVHCGVAVSYGSHPGHFAAMQRMCEEFEVGFRVADSRELAAHWTRVLVEPDFSERVTMGCEALRLQQSHAFDETYEALEQLIYGPKAPSADGDLVPLGAEQGTTTKRWSLM